MRQIPKTMHAVMLTGHGGIDKLVYRTDVEVPVPKLGEVLIVSRVPESTTRTLIQELGGIQNLLPRTQTMGVPKDWKMQKKTTVAGQEILLTFH